MIGCALGVRASCLLSKRYFPDLDAKECFGPVSSTALRLPVHVQVDFANSAKARVRVHSMGKRLVLPCWLLFSMGRFCCCCFCWWWWLVGCWLWLRLFCDVCLMFGCFVWGGVTITCSFSLFRRSLDQHPGSLKCIHVSNLIQSPDCVGTQSA